MQHTRHILATVLLAALVGCGVGAGTAPQPTGAAGATPVMTSRPTTGPNAPGGPGAKPTVPPGYSPAPVTGTNPSGAVASPPGPGASPSGCDADFAAFDVTRDTRLSYQEYEDGRWGQLRFIKAPTAEEEKSQRATFRAEAQATDVDKDGFLSIEEFRKTCG